MIKKNIYNIRVNKFLRTILIVLILQLLIVVAYSNMTADAADDNKQEEVENELSGLIDGQLSEIDFSKFEELVKGLNDKQSGLFGNSSFVGKVQELLSGKFDSNYETFGSFLLSLLFESVIATLPIIATVIAIAVLCSILNSIKSNEKSSNSIIYFACFGAVVLSIAYIVFQLTSVVGSTITTMQTQIDAVFPILLTVLTAIGGTSSVAVFQPLVVVLSTVVSKIMTAIILPLFLIGFVFNIVSSLSPSVKLSKFGKWINSISKWLIGIVFTVFSSFMAIQGITASVYDGVSIKTAKYAISHYIPLVGGYLSDGFNLILAGSVLIKNAVGVAALILLLVTVLVPVIQILAIKLSLQLTSAVLEPLSEGGFGKFVGDVADSLNMLFAIIFSVSFMYFITLLLVVCTANHIF